MAYVVHFLALEPGTDWVDALEAQERAADDLEALTPADGVDIVRPDWWRIASLTCRVLPGAELRRTRRGLTFVDRASGIVLDLAAAEILLSLPYRHDEARALEVLRLAQGIARFVEEETGLTAFDPQIQRPFLESEEGLSRGAAMIVSTKRALAEAVATRRGVRDATAPRPRVR